MTGTSIDALLAAIDAAPDDDDRYLVLADALIAIGDPRGELVILQSERARDPERHALRHAEAACLPAAWGDLVRWRQGLWGEAWRLGFLDSIKVDVGALLRRDLRLGGVDRERVVGELLSGLGIARRMVERWLRALV